jgi:hypothetical protein
LAALLGQFRKQRCGLCPVAVAQDGVNPSAGGVEMDAGQAQATLDWTLE